MSGSDRSANAKVGLKRWLWPAIVFAVAVLAYGVIMDRIHYQDAARNAASYARDAQYQIAAECRVPATATSFQREIQQTRRANQRNEYDLYAQKAVAVWTGVMGAMTVIGIALSGVGVYLIWETWGATREAADNSRSTLDSYIQKERAILRIANAHFQFLDDMAIPAGYQAQIMNFGASPGEIYSVSWEYLRGPSWPEELRFEMWPDNNISVPKDPAATPHLGCEDIQETGMWLAIKIIYTTLGKQTYCSHRAYKLGYDAIDGYGAGGYYAAPLRIANQPSDT